MKVFVLFCSPHKGGATSQELNLFLQRNGLDGDDVERNYFYAYELDATPCVDCGYCRKNKGCAQRDLDGLYSCVEEADVLIIASPVYFLSLPAPAKAVVDRMQRYYSERFFLKQERPTFKRKKTYLVLTYESEKYGGASHLIEQINMLVTVLNSEKPEVYAVRRPE